MPTTIEQKIETLEAALAEGVLEVKYDGMSVRYQSAADLKASISYFKAQLSRAQNRGPVSVSVGAFHRD